MQGAFILVGSNQIGLPLLVCLLIALLTYCAWRFWEGCTGQGCDEANSNARNFFRYRLRFVHCLLCQLAMRVVCEAVCHPRSSTDALDGRRLCTAWSCTCCSSAHALLHLSFSL